jgi:hypothetical protein
MTTTRFNQPWIDRNTRRLSGRKKRAYRKKTGTVTKISRSRTNKTFLFGDHVPEIIIIGFSTVLFVLLLDIFVTVPVFFL